jgi:hemolysin III
MPVSATQKTKYLYPEQKPFFRGRLHHYGFFLYAILGSYVIARTNDHLKKMAFYVYMMATLCLYATSATLHTCRWSRNYYRGQIWMKRLDHVAILLQIAGTYTPLCMNNLPYMDVWPQRMLSSVWKLAFLGVGKALFWDDPPKIINLAYYLSTGFVLFPWAFEIVASIEIVERLCMSLAGLVYVVGGIAYGKEYPDPNPALFGFHEVFHLCTIFGNLLFFIPLAVGAIN